MNVLWIVNHPFPSISEAIGEPKFLSQGWLIDLADKLSKTENVNFAVVSACSGHKFHTGRTGNITYYVLPIARRYNGTAFYDSYWHRIVEDFKPDLVNIFGTEKLHGLSFVNTYPQIKTILTIQGTMNRIADEYYGGLSLWDVLWNRTFKENITFGGMLGVKLYYQKLKKFEQVILKRVKHIVCRTLWERTILKGINPDACLHTHYWNLRETFYSAEKWDYDKIEKYSVYTSLANYPLKGLHILIRALCIVREQYGNVKLYVPGIDGDEQGGLIADTGYKKYIVKLIKKLGLSQNIIFLGGQTASQVAERMQKAHIVVVPSAIESDSATVCEAMQIGVPCICTYRGGMVELIKHNQNGFFYDFAEYSYLAERIMDIFADSNLAKKFSNEIIKSAVLRNGREKNFEDMLKIYTDVLGKAIV